MFSGNKCSYVMERGDDNSNTNTFAKGMCYDIQIRKLSLAWALQAL